MCGRFALTIPQTAVSRIFEATPVDLKPMPPRYNICPTQPVETILAGPSGGREHRQLRWGFIARWYKSPSDGPLLINARAETIAEKPAFREACRRRRCLIPASGFYEWRRENGARQPFYISPADGGPIAFAGIWEVWRGPAGEEIAACAVVTTAAGPEMARIHHREPVLIAARDRAKWLGEAGPGAALLMRPAPPGMLTFRAVSPRVNNAREDDPDLIRPIDAPTD